MTAAAMSHPPRAMCPPAVRTLAIEASIKEHDDGTWEVVTRHYPVLAIVMRNFDRKKQLHDQMSSPPRYEHLIHHPQHGLCEASFAFSDESVKGMFAVCPWPPEKDEQLLAVAIKALEVSAAEAYKKRKGWI